MYTNNMNMSENVETRETGNHSHDTGVAFEINLDEDRTKLCRTPTRLCEYQKKPVSKEELDQKQLEAEKRRKDLQEEMIKRVSPSKRQVEKLNTNGNALLEQAAIRQGGQGTQDLPVLSQQQLKQKFHAVNQDYLKMACGISANTHVPK